MSPEEFQWPTRDDYDLAMKDLQHSAVDPELRTAVTVIDVDEKGRMCRM
jgi:hypothetical protein